LLEHEEAPPPPLVLWHVLEEHENVFLYSSALCYKADESADESKKGALVKRLKVK
jgi:hypothetical protein